MRVVFAGTPEAAVPSLDALLGSSHDLVAVLTRPDARVGRGRRPAESPVAARAQAAGVPVLKHARLRDPAVGDELRALEPDCVPVVAYGALVPPALLDLPAHGWVNLHFSLLPAWRGAAPVQHAVLHGDDVTGATTFRLDEGLDTGPVYGVLTEPVRPTDTSGELLDRLARAGAGLLVATLDGIERGELTAVPQSPDGVSLAPKLVPADARVDWNASALRVDRLVRACTPAPGAWTTLRGDRVGLGPVRPLDGDAAVLVPGNSVLAPGNSVLSPGKSGLAPGQVRVLRNRVLVGCGNGLAVELGEVRPAGRKAMAAADWARGLREVDGERLV